MRSIRVLVADDHPVVRAGIASILATQPDFEVVGDAATGAEAVTGAVALAPDVILMDLRMPVQNGVSAIEEIRRGSPDVRIIVLTTYATDGEILRAIEAGALGYLLKDVPHEELFRALRAVARGERYIAPVVTDRLVACRHGDQAPLTERELSVLRCVARGSPNKVIATELGITEPTVKAHLVHIFEKLSVENRTAAVHTAVARGLLDGS